MSVNNILDSIYTIPVILDHMDYPTNTTEKILSRLGIDNGDIEELRNIRSLLEYHLKFIEGKADYTLLRKGLSEYFNTYLSGMFDRLGLTDKTGTFLDYCCGQGQYAEQWIKDNPKSTVMLVDKVNETMFTSPVFLQKDFEKDPDWYKNFKNSFDYVLLAEILHCKDDQWQYYLVKSSQAMLKRGGKLIVVENVDYPMAYRISKVKGQEYNVVDIHKIHDMFHYDQTWKTGNKRLCINQHHIYVYEKI